MESGVKQQLGQNTTLRATSPTLRKVHVFFNVPRQQYGIDAGDEMGTTVYHPYLRRLEHLTICRCYSKGRTFSLVTFRS